MKGNTYQIIVVLDPKLESKAQDAVLKSVTGWISEAGGTTKKPKELGKKTLDYEVAKNTTGEFYEFTVESEKGLQTKDMNLYLNREVSIIRYLVLKK